MFGERHGHDYISFYRAEIYATHDETGLTDMDTLFPNQLNTSKICVTDVFGNTGQVHVGYKGGNPDPIFPTLDEPATLAVTLANTLLNTLTLSGRKPFVVAPDTPDAQLTVQSVQDHAITWTVTKLAKHAQAGEAHSLVVFWNARGWLPESLLVTEAAQRGTSLAQGSCFSAIYMNTDTFIDDMPAVGESVHVSAADIAAALDGATSFTPQRVVLAGHVQSPLYHLSEDPSHYDMDSVLQTHFSVWCYVDDEWTLYGSVHWDRQRNLFI